MKNPQLLECESGVMKDTGYGNKVYSTFGYGTSTAYRCLMGEQKEFQFDNRKPAPEQVSI